MDCMKGTQTRVMMCQNENGAYSKHGCMDEGDTEMRMVKLDTASCPVCDAHEAHKCK